MNGCNKIETTVKDDLVQRLTGAGAIFNGNSCTCPFHRDRHPSAGIYQSENGTWRFKCQVCGHNLDAVGVEAKLTGKSPEDVLKEATTGATTKQSYSEDEIRNRFSTNNGYKYLHEYRTEVGELSHFVACKYEGERKSFIQIKRYGFNFVMANNGMRPLFRLDRIKDKQEILLVEGEKCVLALEYVGIDYGTTCMGGAKSVSKADLAPLRGKKVFIWPDNDTAGKEYAEDLKKALTDLDCTVGVVDIETLNMCEKEDVADFVSRYIKTHSKEEIKDEIEYWVKNARFSGYFDTFMAERVADIKSGVLKSLEIGFHHLCKSKFLMGGTVTLLCARPGLGKTWFVHNLAIRCHNSGYKVADIQLEDDKNYHISRILSVLTKCDLTDPDTTTEADLSKVTENRELIEDLAKMIVIPDESQKNLLSLAKIIDDKAKAGCQIILVDSISVASKSGKTPWEDDHKFVNMVKVTTERHKCRVILVTHPKGGKSAEFSLDSLAGGQAYQRLCQTVLWLTGEEGRFNVYGQEGKFFAEEAQVNRVMYCLKSRNSRSDMLSNKFAFNFEKGSFHELGYI